MTFPSNLDDSSRNDAQEIEIHLPTRILTITLGCNVMTKKSIYLQEYTHINTYIHTYIHIYIYIYIYVTSRNQGMRHPPGSQVVSPKAKNK